MKAREVAGPSLAILAVTVWTLGCGESPTSPESPNFKKGKPPTQAPKVSLANLSLAGTLFTIDGDHVGYTVDIVNTGGKQSPVTLQGEVRQGTTIQAAGGIGVLCGGNLGVLPHGTCSMAFGAGAMNLEPGAGLLVPGAATLVLLVIGPDGGTLASQAVAITLQE